MHYFHLHHSASDIVNEIKWSIITQKPYCVVLLLDCAYSLSKCHLKAYNKQSHFALYYFKNNIKVSLFDDIWTFLHKLSRYFILKYIFEMCLFDSMLP